jgi:hypothetical protein
MSRRFPLVHVRIQGLDCAIFCADALDGSNDTRSMILAELTARARRRLSVDKRALVFYRGGTPHFFGDRDLVDYLANNWGSPRWTHEITL